MIWKSPWAGSPPGCTAHRGSSAALSQLTGETPIVLLDDVMSELDQSRQDYLLNHLHGRQVFITCCSPETVSLQETGMRFRVEAGEVFPEEVERAAGL